jgi:hypothetical protein
MGNRSTLAIHDVERITPSCFREAEPDRGTANLAALDRCVLVDHYAGQYSAFGCAHAVVQSSFGIAARTSGQRGPGSVCVAPRRY